MKIEKNIPLPEFRGKNASIIKTMKKGESIVLQRKDASSWRASAHSLGVKASVRKISDTECRFWRVS